MIRPASLASLASRPIRLSASILGMMALAACDDFRFPRDPNGTLERVLAADRMRVVAVDHVPWVVVDGDGVPAGVEVDTVQAFARALGVTVEWRRAPAFEALEALKRGDADLAVGGFTRSSVAAHGGAAHTYAYFTETLVVAAEPGAAVPDDLEGLKVYVAPDLLADGLVEEAGGIPVAEDAGDVRLALVPDWWLPASGLVPTPIELHRDDHVIAVPQGENAWVMRLERFLRARVGATGARLREYAS
ncbi:substrate-binding periplasmic protein [Arenibaculum sp.]|uniref:substrate-binding periplasmic protein n=1 Tax=Arenibaculum sp. TaxID=2865862 RepID=UPI002E0E7DBF|nr:transporter substrate-binding domain-containing protein [Arenibaculum sp.]